MSRAILRAGLSAVLLVLALGACEREVRLEGERLDIRTPLEGAAAEPADLGARPFSAPAARANADWTHRGGNDRHNLVNPALAGALQPVWSVRFGEGESRRQRITADPIVANGRVFVMDSESTVSAISTAGQLLWQAPLVPDTDSETDATPGALATDGTRVYATSGFGRLAALDAATGAEIWTQRLGAAATSAPTVAGGTVYAVGNDSRAWALDAETGRIVWEVLGVPSQSGVLGGASPAVTDRLILLPSSSAELIAVLKLSGFRVWNTPVAGQRLGRVYARFTDVTGDPVVDGDRVYVGNPSGRTMALELASGEVVWSAEEGALSPVQVAGGSVFLVSDQNELVRLDAETGTPLWRAALPYFTKERVRRRRAIFDHYGPVLAGGRLIVGSGDGVLRVFDPANGSLVQSVPLPGGAATLPAVAGGTLYVVSSSGELHAFR